MGSHPLRPQNFPHINKKHRFGRTSTFSNKKKMFASFDLKNEEINYLDHWTHLQFILKHHHGSERDQFHQQVAALPLAGGHGINLFLPVLGVKVCLSDLLQVLMSLTSQRNTTTIRIHDGGKNTHTYKHKTSIS